MVLIPAWRKLAWGLGLALSLCAAVGLLAVGWIHQRNRQTMKFQSISGPIANPLMGFAPWATSKEIKQPHTLVYADLTWREFEPERGVYDFEGFEKKNQLDRWRSENKRVVFRFVLDKPGEEPHLDIPDWLYEAIGGSGDHYFNEYGQGFSPDYAHSILIQYHREAIRALGQRYGADGLFAYIELGSLGHWGEWHVHYGSGIRRLPSESIRDQYVQHYVEAFPDTFLLMRRPFNIASRLNLGLYNDMTGDPRATQEWLDWIALGGRYEQTKEPHALASMPNGWKTAPVGGEQTFSLNQDYIYGGGLAQTVRLLQESHATFIGPHGPYQEELGGPLQSGIDTVLASIGYRLYIRQAQLPLWVWWDKKLNFTLTFANDGVAPMYYNWPAQLYFFDAGGALVKTHPVTMDLRKIIPGEPYPVQVTVSLSGLDPGKYTLGFAILDPRTGEPAVRLAMANPRGDLIQAVGSFEILSLNRLFLR